MKDIVKTFEGQNVRIQMINKEPHFCASDVGNVLGLSNVYRQIKPFLKGVHSVTTLTTGGKQEIIYISEPNLYRLIFQSRKEEAKLFQDWIFEEVIPSIRQTGGYSIAPDLKSKSIETRKMLTEEWHNNGVKEGWEFGKLTLAEYRALKFKDGKRKKDLNEGELKALLALEAMEMLNLHYNPVDGYLECKNSVESTAIKVLEIKTKELR